MEGELLAYFDDVLLPAVYGAAPVRIEAAILQVLEDLSVCYL